MTTRFRRSFRACNDFDPDEGGGGGFADGGGSVATAEPAAAPAPAEAKPTSMADAMWNRDELGRFAPKNPDGSPMTQADVAAAAPAAAAQPAQVDPNKPAPVLPEDPLQMPEGLQPKAQERFQALANTNRELTAKAEQLEQQVSYIRETFQQHGVRQDQFEQAASVIGMLNSGNLEGALRVLDEQRRQIALALGKPLPGVDILAEHADLRAAVDGLQITEEHAAEIARSRAMQQSQQQQRQTQQREQESQRVQQQQIQAGTLAVDKLAKQLQSTDLDYPAIEAKLMPMVGDLFKDVPPERWAAVFHHQYNLVKQLAAGARVAPPAPASQQVLRPTGNASPAARPTSMAEAMWGKSLSA